VLREKLAAGACEYTVGSRYRCVGYEATNAPAFQLGSAVDSFPFCVAEVDESFLAQAEFCTAPRSGDVGLAHSKGNTNTSHHMHEISISMDVT
jgi:hypothetical protein